jgi:ArsR family transcriptional regulator
VTKQLLPLVDEACCAPLASAALTPEQSGTLAPMFKALADPVRLRLLSLITSQPGEVCVCELTPRFDLAAPTISHHLKVLREAGLIDCERRGTWVYYWAVPGPLDQLAGVLGAARSTPAATG